MSCLKQLWFVSIILISINLVPGQALGAADKDAQTDTAWQRSRDSHPIDEFPVFDKPDEQWQPKTEEQSKPKTDEQSSAKTEEKAAQKQIEESIRNDDENNLEPKTSGDVMVTTKDKVEASKASTEIVNETPQENREMPVQAKLRRPTIALALGGGGVRGCAHIGVIRVLKEAGIPIDYIVGNSMGAIVGGLYAAGVPLDQIEKTTQDNSLQKAYLPGKVATKLLVSPLRKVVHPFKKHYAGIWTGEKLSNFFEKHLPEGVENVEDTVIPFSAVATNLIDGKAYRISDGKLSMVMRASSTIPPYLQPVAIGDKVYIDGGLRANLPASAARDTGADIVIAVLVDEPLRDVPAKRFRKLGSIIERMGDVMLAVADARQLPFADIIINPDVSGLPVLNGKPEEARRAVLAGELATRNALPEIRKRLFERNKNSTLSAEKVPATVK